MGLSLGIAAPGSRVPLKACSRLAPLICRSPSARKQAPAGLVPRLPNRPGFDDGCVPFDRTSAVHSRSSSWNLPDKFYSLFPGLFNTWELIPTQRRMV